LRGGRKGGSRSLGEGANPCGAMDRGKGGAATATGPWELQRGGGAFV